MATAPLVKICDGLVVNWLNITWIGREDDEYGTYTAVFSGGKCLALSAAQGKQLEEYLANMGDDITVAAPAAAVDAPETPPVNRFKDLVDDA